MKFGPETILFKVQPQRRTIEPERLYPPENPILGVFFDPERQMYQIAEWTTLEGQPGYLPIETALSIEHAECIIEMMLDLYRQEDPRWRDWRADLCART